MSENTGDIKRLLDEVGKLVLLDKERQQQAWERGEHFNIFTVLDVQTREVKTHSALLAELLDPQGSHGLGDKFLTAFVDLMPQLKSLGLETEKARVEVEKYIGEKSETSGGRIDIVISTEDKAIVIENKIYACDQESQLLRYHNWLSKHFKTDQTRLFYLTLDGHDASDFSKGDKNIRVQPIVISYCEQISQWLDRCIAIAAQKPLVRESLVQYRNLINKLTGNTMENEEKVVEHIVKNEESYSAARVICQQFHSAKLEKNKEIIQNWLQNDAKRKLNEKNVHTGKVYNLESDCPYSGFGFDLDDSGLSIWFEFNKGGLFNLCYGIVDEGKSGKLPAIQGWEHSDLWPYRKWMREPFRNYNNEPRFYLQIRVF